MAVTINGSTGITFPLGGIGNPAGTVVGTSDSQTLTNKTLAMPNIDSAQFATVSGTAPLYAARAWVNFNGTGAVAIRASGNVSSITDNGTGDYTVNFATAMSDANYEIQLTSATGSAPSGSSYGRPYQPFHGVPSITTLRVYVSGASGGSVTDPALVDREYVHVAIVR